MGSLLLNAEDLAKVRLSTSWGPFTETLLSLLALRSRRSSALLDCWAESVRGRLGPETALLYGTLAPRAHSFYRALPCSPCLTAFNHRNSPCDGDNQCLKRISADEVLAKAREFLAARSSEIEEASPQRVIHVSSI